MAALATILSIATYAGLVFTMPPPQCFANFNWRDCGKSPQPVIYYWKPGSRCEVGFWRGCLPNINMFKDEYECVSTCIFTVRAAEHDWHNINDMEEDITGNMTDYEDKGNITTESEGDNVTESEGKPESGSEGEPGSKSEPVTEPETGSKDESVTDPVAEAESVTDTGSETESTDETVPSNDIAPEHETESTSNTESLNETESVDVTEPAADDA